jgi:phenylacetate-CoA ligase
MSVATSIDLTSREAILGQARELLGQERWPRERLLDLQRERLGSLLRHAVEGSPYYREALGPEAAHADLTDLPTLPKRVLMERFDEVVTDRRLRLSDLEAFLAEADAGAAYLGAYRVFSTAGSTGVPGVFVYTHEELARWIAVAFAALARLGVNAETRFVAIGAPSALHITRQMFAAMQSGRGDVPRLTVLTPFAEMVEALNRYQPQALLGYASVVAMLADEQLERRLAIRPRVAICTSEVLTEDAAGRIEEAWGIRPCNAYASTEAPPTATGSLDHVGMHVWESELVLEVVDDHGRHVPPGVPGSKVLLTNLVNRAQPLIRYELSDSVVIEPEQDPSGRPYLRLARVDGRSDDILRLPAALGGEIAVHPFRLRAPFVRLHDVRQYQVVRKDDRLLVRVVVRDGAPRDLPERVRASIASVLSDAGAAFPVGVEIVAGLEREQDHAGKLKLVVSEVAPAT